MESIYARYLYEKNGYDEDIFNCERFLKLGERYKVLNFNMECWVTYIKLEGFKVAFNSVNFKIEDENGKECDLFGNEIIRK